MSFFHTKSGDSGVLFHTSHVSGQTSCISRAGDPQEAGSCLVGQQAAEAWLIERIGRSGLGKSGPLFLHSRINL